MAGCSCRRPILPTRGRGLFASEPVDEPEKLPVAGRVVWITPEGAQGNRQAGIGIEFSDQDVGIPPRLKIIWRLVGSDRVTHTL